MQRSQVFKVKGMQRDASMPNTTGEFAYEILNMRLIPATEDSALSLTNEKGTVECSNINLIGEVIGQCPTNNSIVVFTVNTKSVIPKEEYANYIYNIYEEAGEWYQDILYQGDLGLSCDNPIEALFNYETLDIRKVYWIDGINQLRCINIATPIEDRQLWNDTSFDSIKEVNQLPKVSIERTSGGTFTAGVIQYYVTYFNEFMSESPIIYTSPLLYIAHEERGAKTNDKVNTAIKLTLSDLNIDNWKYIRIYATHRSSLEATPEASIIMELKIPEDRKISYVDYGGNRIAIAPSDIQFVGGKFVKAGTMTAKDQVLFLGHLQIESVDSTDRKSLQQLFNELREVADSDAYFTTRTRRTKSNRLAEYEDTYYKYDFQLNNTESITHYKFGEKYRFGISVLDNYGNWSNPIWIKDAIIEATPKQLDSNTLGLPCPELNLSYEITEGEYQGKTLYDVLFDVFKIKGIKPLVVYPSLEERKVLTQGVVCPTVYNLKDRKENGPYAQASWFMRPNAPVDLWGRDSTEILNWVSDYLVEEPGTLYHASDLIYPNSPNGYNLSNLFNTSGNKPSKWLDTRLSLIYDDLSVVKIDTDNKDPNSTKYISGFKYDGYNDDDADEKLRNAILLYNPGIDTPNEFFDYTQDNSVAKDIVESGSWVEFRHNYALRTKGWTWGPTNDWYHWSFGLGDYSISDNDSGDSAEWQHDNYALGYKTTDLDRGGVTFLFRNYDGSLTGQLGNRGANGLVAIDHTDAGYSGYDRVITYKFRTGGYRSAELDTSRFGVTIPVNRFAGKDINTKTWRGVDLVKFNTGNSAYYVDNSIVTLNSPEIELEETTSLLSTNNYNFRIVGVIPLTATISDISLETSGTVYNPSSNQDVSFGFKKVIAQVKNIGKHGFKGLVAHSGVYNGFQTESSLIEQEYSDGNFQGYTDGGIFSKYYSASFPVHPWQSTGNITGFPANSSDKLNSFNLKRKILSNLRYSANTCFFDNETVWTPCKGSNIQWFTSEDTDIIKLPLDGYREDIVYSANIDSIALATTGDNNNQAIPIYYTFYNRKIVPTNTLEPTYLGYDPYVGGVCFDDMKKLSIGTAIKYKSSKHAVVGFNAIPVVLQDGTQKWAQEILPTFSGINMIHLDNSSLNNLTLQQAGVLYENPDFISIPHQEILGMTEIDDFGLPGYGGVGTNPNDGRQEPGYGWLWLGEIYKEQEPTFGGTSEFALQNNMWESADGDLRRRLDTLHPGDSFNTPGYIQIEGETETQCIYLGQYNKDFYSTLEIFDNSGKYTILIQDIKALENIFNFVLNSDSSQTEYTYTSPVFINNVQRPATLSIRKNETPHNFKLIIQSARVTFTLPSVSVDVFPIHHSLRWTQGDTYYQRFDTLKTYAFTEKDENSIIDITSFMVETRINIDGRTDRNRGQSNNLQMSPTNFNLLNKVYTQKDDFITYRILDDDVQKRTYFPNQITWSLSKVAGASVDSWLNITLASILDLDGTKGDLTALKTFNNNIIAFQESGISTILFNSRVQLATSEAVPIQIANSGKVDGQQYFTTDLGCQDKWTIVTSPQGLYFVDSYNKSIYRFNGQLEDLASANGFRGWCNKYITNNSQILGYYDRKNKEVMYYFDNHSLRNEPKAKWLGFSELSNTFSSFYSYPKAALINVKDVSMWLYRNTLHLHQEGDYNYLLDGYYPYGLTVQTKQDSNITKVFNTVEFRADTYYGDTLRNFDTFDTIQIEDEHDGVTSMNLEYSKYHPSSLKKLNRTWKANIPRVANGHKRYVNQWAKVGMWMLHPNSIPIEHNEKTILHDLAVWYTE